MGFYNALDNPNSFVISFGKNPLRDFHMFARGYHNAAAVLADKLLSCERFSDYDAYPIVFLYRHSFELYLKNIIYKSAALLAFKSIINLDTGLCNTHKLKPLADRVAKILQSLFPNESEISMISLTIGQFATEFSEIDGDSYSYRYPIDKNGDYSTAAGQIINLESMHNSMHKLLNSLDIIDFGINVEAERAQEISELLDEIIKESNSTIGA